MSSPKNLIIEYKEYGLSKARMEPYKYASWTRGETTLEIVSPVQHEIPCIALPYCPSAKLEAELIDVKDGMPGDFEAVSRNLSPEPSRGIWDLR